MLSMLKQINYLKIFILIVYVHKLIYITITRLYSVICLRSEIKNFFKSISRLSFFTVTVHWYSD